MNFMWNELTKEELKHLYYNESLSDRQIADLFGVPKSKVTYIKKEIRNIKLEKSISKIC